MFSKTLGGRIFQIAGGLVNGFLQVLSGHNISVKSSALVVMWLTQQSIQNLCSQFDMEYSNGLGMQHIWHYIILLFLVLDSEFIYYLCYNMYGSIDKAQGKCNNYMELRKLNMVILHSEFLIWKLFQILIRQLKLSI